MGPAAPVIQPSMSLGDRLVEIKGYIREITLTRRVKPVDAAHLLQATQQHGAIENNFHRVMNVTFGEGRSRTRNEDSAEKMAVLRAIALKLLKRNSSRSSLGQKCFCAAIDNDFLLHLLTQF